MAFSLSQHSDLNVHAQAQAFETASLDEILTWTWKQFGKKAAIGTSYQAGPAKLYAAWSQSKQPAAAAVAATGLVQIVTATKANIFDVGVDYALTGNLHLLGSVIYDRANINRVTTGATKVSSTQLNVGVDYYLSKRTDVYALYTNQRAKDVINPGVVNAAYSSSPADDSSQNVVRLGLRHRF